MEGGEIVRGKWSGETEAKEWVYASVQPASDKELLSLEEGRRSRKSFVLFTSTPLETVGVQNPPRIRLFGDDYEVVRSEPWQNGVLSHFRLLVQKLEAVDA